MLEKIYTIPVNEAFDACRDDPSLGCPVCLMYRKLQAEALDTILGGAMMEPDIRIKTNEQGFCAHHMSMLLTKKNRLGLALILESHLDQINERCADKPLAAMTGTKGVPAAKEIARLDGECYICGKIEDHFSKMLSNILWLWESEKEFREKFDASPYICLPHYRRLIDSKTVLPKKLAPDFCDALRKVTFDYFDELRGDVKHFIKKFDYRFDDEPWGNSKDSVERAAKFLRGDRSDV